MNKQDTKNMFLNNFDFMVKSLYGNVPKPIIHLYGMCHFETFTVLHAIVSIDCTYPPYYEGFCNRNISEPSKN